MIKYYDASFGDYERISVVSWFDCSSIDNRFGKAIPKSDLPADYVIWPLYEHFTNNDCIVQIFSRGGD